MFLGELPNRNPKRGFHKMSDNRIHISLADDTEILKTNYTNSKNRIDAKKEQNPERILEITYGTLKIWKFQLERGCIEEIQKMVKPKIYF